MANQPKTRTSGRTRSGADAAGRWSTDESETAFAAAGDRIISGTRRFLRSSRRQRMQAELYTVHGQELTLAQVDSLEAVAAGDIRMHELAAHLEIDPSTATRTTAPLVDLGLLERYVDPANRRYVVLRCTREGRAAANRIIDQRRGLMREILGAMDPKRRLLFADLLEEYIDLTEQYQDRDSTRER